MTKQEWIILGVVAITAIVTLGWAIEVSRPAGPNRQYTSPSN